MSPALFGVICILCGVCLLGLPAFGYIRDARIGMKTLDGKIIAVNHDTQTLRIQYKDKEQYYEFDRHDLRCFATGKFPKIGLKVGVRVRKEDPSVPVSVLIQRSYLNGKRDDFINTSRFLSVIRLGVPGGLLIIGGILLLTGQIA